MLALLDPATQPELGNGVAESAPTRAMTKATGNGRPMTPTTTNRKKNRIPPTIVPMALIPSQSATRMSPGFPASASRFSVRSVNDELVTRETDPDSRADKRSQGSLDERRLELELLEVLGLHRSELRQPRLDRIHGRAARQRKHDQQDRPGGDGRDDDGQDGHDD